MKRLPFSRRLVAFRCGLREIAGCALFQCGIVEGHFVTMERTYFDKRPVWVRYYTIRVRSGPSSVRGTVASVPASGVFRYPVTEAL